MATGGKLPPPAPEPHAQNWGPGITVQGSRPQKVPVSMCVLREVLDAENPAQEFQKPSPSFVGVLHHPEHLLSISWAQDSTLTAPLPACSPLALVSSSLRRAQQARCRLHGQSEHRRTTRVVLFRRDGSNVREEQDRIPPHMGGRALHTKFHFSY